MVIVVVTQMANVYTKVSQEFLDELALNYLCPPEKDLGPSCAESPVMGTVKSSTKSIVTMSTILINEIIAAVVQKIGEYTKKHTKIEKQGITFLKTF